MQFHYTYIITNTQPTSTEQYYIGVRSCSCVPFTDNYYGSSTYLKQAIKEQGISVFKKEILEIFDTRYEANLSEINLHEKYSVNNNPLYYNKTNAQNPKYNIGVYKHSDEFKQALRERMLTNNPFKGKKHSDQTKQLMSDKALGRTPWNKNKHGMQESWNKGKTKDSSVALQSVSTKMTGANNPMFSKTGKAHHHSKQYIIHTPHTTFGPFYTRKELKIFCVSNKFPFNGLYNTVKTKIPYNDTSKNKIYSKFNNWFIVVS